MRAARQLDVVEPTSLQDLAGIADLGLLVTKLARMISAEEASGQSVDGASHNQLIERVKSEVRRRKLRCELLNVPQDMFSMPAWEILMELFLAELLGQKNNVSTVGIEAGIPQSTAQRWLVLLERRNLVRRRRDLLDRRRQWIGLTPQAYKALCRYFAA